MDETLHLIASIATIIGISITVVIYCLGRESRQIEKVTRRMDALARVVKIRGEDISDIYINKDNRPLNV